MDRTVVKEKEPKLLIVVDGELSTIFLKERMTLGRKTKSSTVDIDLKKRYVSRKHGIIGHDKTGVYFIDNNSTFGTYLNDRKIDGGEKNYLSDGDILSIYNNSLLDNEDFVSVILMKEYPDKYKTKYVDLPSKLGQSIVIGRADDADITVMSPLVSKKHARISLDSKGEMTIEDLGSSNGVNINGSRIYDISPIKLSDNIEIGNSNFIVVKDRLAYLRPSFELSMSREDTKKNFSEIILDIKIKERNVRKNFKKFSILKDINIQVKSGQMVLIVGGSGTGKTTFINAVMGYEKANASIHYGDIDIYKDNYFVQNKISFVPQKDLVRNNDTVYFTLRNAADMKMAGYPDEDIEKRVDYVLSALGLTNERNHLVSKLSGGQKKRLSIAVEYISDPDMFFLDEPDSGLDGAMATKIFENLREIADEGKIVMIISHSPDRKPELFDKIIILAKSNIDNCGRLAFYGNINEAYDFFEVYSLDGAIRKVKSFEEGGLGMSDYYIEKFSRRKDGK